MGYMIVKGLDMLKLILEIITDGDENEILFGMLTGDIKLVNLEDKLRVELISSDGESIIDDTDNVIDNILNNSGLPEDIKNILKAVDEQVKESENTDDLRNRLKLLFSQSNGKLN